MASSVSITASSLSPPRHTVIIGGGIVGASTLYYAAKNPIRGKSSPPSRLTLIEASSELAPGASGKSGGFLALDWHGTATSSLAELSYRLHREIAKEGNGGERWGYRAVETLQVNIDTTKSRSKCPKELNWVDPSIVTSTSTLGSSDTTAQVTPKHLVEYMVEAALKHDGVEARLATAATSLDLDDQGKVRGLRVRNPQGQDDYIECDCIVVAAGPWTGSLLNSLLPGDSSNKVLAQMIRKGKTIDGSRAHSIVVRGTRPTTEHCLFTDMKYVPKNSAEKHAKLVEQIRVISPEILGESATIEKEQACYLPGGSFNGPLIDGSSEHGLYIAAGHTCWGITLGPGTGLVMAEMIFEGKALSADVDMLKA
ncbi:hypothetical protein OOU_Y34scaffold00251g15 [Pyricularia oryzae Y34]|uniref:FAD dependent oxidoreductase domain-containing protein n=1 Tax=Pyricularia oryzae (strain Y34) TaxID=1143189 RepID=A0AA97P4N2_PYRO3|nr:hypothetical protein OOU_Y34scaffold00251g15 [Pyricularia oryzae Y34]